MRKDAILINTARGDLIDEETLLVVVMKEDQLCTAMEDEIEEIKNKIKKILRG
ncbi:MAG: NAD(P)-dependent oxidoreductase [Promethearchaeota archaeon]